MPIPVVLESPDLYENLGVYEMCVFCKKTTKHRHWETNTPVCEQCAETHSENDIVK